MDPITILTALLPVLVEGGKYAVQRWLAPESVKPGTFTEFLQMRAQDLEFFKQMQGGDAGSFAWVEAVRQLQRPMFAAAVLGVWCVQSFNGEPSATVANMAGAVGFYLFGDRTLFYIKRGAA